MRARTPAQRQKVAIAASARLSKAKSLWDDARYSDEATGDEVERDNDDAAVGVVVAKRRGKSDPAKAVVFMTLEAFARLVGGVD
jgi:hypothetical protein